MRISNIQESENRNDPDTTSGISKWCNRCPIGRSRSKQGWTGGRRSTEGGFSTLGAALVLIVFLIGTGLFLIQNQINNRITTQIDLDHLTGNMVIQMRASLITREQSENRLRIAKAAVISGCIYLPACPALQRAYELQKKIEDGIQTTAKLNWYAQKTKWILFKPLLSGKSEFPDWDKHTNEFVLKIQYAGLISSSKLWTNSGGITHEWKIAWIE